MLNQMDDGRAGYMGAVRWVNFNHYGEPESGEARTMDDGSVWARIAGPDPRGDDDRWVPLLDSAGVEAALLAPTAMNQQKFVFSLKEDRVSIKPGLGFYSKVDLGIVKYHFELGAGDVPFQWA